MNMSFESIITAEYFYNSICSSRSHIPCSPDTYAMPSLVIFTFMGLRLLMSTLKEHTWLYFLISHNLTAPSCPQLNSS